MKRCILLLVSLAITCAIHGSSGANALPFVASGIGSMDGRIEIARPEPVAFRGRGGIARRTTVVGRRGYARRTTVVRPGRRGGGVRRAGVVRPGWHGGGTRWARPARYWWRPGTAIAAGAAIGWVTAATAVAWAGAAPGPNMCWYYTDASRTKGFWDACP
jgi:hypothetical protein